MTIDPEVDGARSIRTYEKAGFRLKGLLHRNDCIDGRWVGTHDVVILEDDWPAARAGWSVAEARGGAAD